jgi:hypothetical protein
VKNALSPAIGEALFHTGPLRLTRLTLNAAALACTLVQEVG